MSVELSKPLFNARLQALLDAWAVRLRRGAPGSRAAR
jgi:hypothetical protein